MGIVNLIVVGETSQHYQDIVDIIQFPIIDDQLSQEVFSEAEEVFRDILERMGVDDIESAVEDGIYREGNTTVHLVFTEIEGL